MAHGGNCYSRNCAGAIAGGARDAGIGSRFVDLGLVGTHGAGVVRAASAGALDADFVAQRSRINLGLGVCPRGWAWPDGGRAGHRANLWRHVGKGLWRDFGERRCRRDAELAAQWLQPPASFFYGLLPQNAAELISYTVYRWECAIRSSVVLGFVGAGGLGQQLDGSMKMFAGGEVSTILLVFVALVGIADFVSSWLRRQLG